MTCRNVSHRRRNRDLDVYPASKGWEVPADGPTGVRHEGGVTLRQAPIRNTGTCRPDVKGETQAVSHREGPSQGNRVKPIKSFLRTAITLWVMSARRSVLLSESRLKNRST